jgi:UDP-N-acetylglucosamine--N-acetylmuramyl-(pentapeptide) pyrophosphoryl-undecaprenol N-acetylglucosamine transferase
MDLAYAAADVIISRAGAIAVSELCIIGKPVILVPSPNVAEDHQTKNALALVDKNAAILVKDNEAEEKLIETVVTLIEDTTKQNLLKENCVKLGIPNAAERIVTTIKEIVA